MNWCIVLGVVVEVCLILLLLLLFLYAAGRLFGWGFFKEKRRYMKRQLEEFTQEDSGNGV
jgi:hypothetical protein